MELIILFISKKKKKKKHRMPYFCHEIEGKILRVGLHLYTSSIYKSLICIADEILNFFFWDLIFFMFLNCNFFKMKNIYLNFF
jgi:hypothetical protein